MKYLTEVVKQSNNTVVLWSFNQLQNVSNSVKNVLVLLDGRHTCQYAAWDSNKETTLTGHSRNKTVHEKTLKKLIIL